MKKSTRTKKDSTTAHCDNYTAVNMARLSDHLTTVTTMPSIMNRRPSGLKHLEIVKNAVNTQEEGELLVLYARD